jgi:hypothetical protein
MSVCDCHLAMSRPSSFRPHMGSCSFLKRASSVLVAWRARPSQCMCVLVSFFGVISLSPRISWSKFWRLLALIREMHYRWRIVPPLNGMSLRCTSRGSTNQSSARRIHKQKARCTAREKFAFHYYHYQSLACSPLVLHTRHAQAVLTIVSRASSSTNIPSSTATASTT